MLIAQISDPHILSPGHRLGGRIDAAGLLVRCLASLEALTPRPDLAVISGDLVNGGLPEEYQHLRRLLASLSIPVRLMAGNHDDRVALRAAFPDHDYLRQDPRYLHCALDAGPLRLLLLDTVDPGKDSGILDDARLAWLERQLASAPGTPTLVFMHHPPFASGLAAMDAMACANSDALRALIQRNPQVERIACGHVHRPIMTRWAGTLAVTAPSSAHQMALDLGRNAVPRYTLEPPAFLLHRWNAGELTTHVIPVGPHLGPYDY